MSGAICLVDTSVLLEILKVPGKCGNRQTIFDDLEKKIKDKEVLFLPMATIIETGNHVAQNGDGTQRRKCAADFVQFVQDALDDKSPFHPIKFIENEQLNKIISQFTDYAMKGISLGDACIIDDYERLCEQYNRHKTIYVWALDGDLSSYRQTSMV